LTKAVDIDVCLGYFPNCWNAGTGTFGTSPSDRYQQVLLANLKKEDAMKKIALTMVAVATLGLAACQGAETANNSAGNESETTNEANEDVGNASDTENAANDALSDVVNTGSDAASAVGNAASSAANTVENAVDGNSNR
jgi:hypothetical protein